MNIYKEVLEEYKVSKEEHDNLISKANKILEQVQEQLDNQGVKAEVMLGGSAAKGTFVKGDFDCDVFVRFDKQYLDDQLSDFLEEALKIFPGVKRVHGSRDYFQVNVEGIDYEFVPVKKIYKPEEANNVTDSSPLHVEWMKNHIQKNPSIMDCIILAKLFCKAHGIYGAESYVRGFSGHVIDILLVYYQSFENLLKNAPEWDKYAVIDVEGHGTDKEMNESKILSLIVIDPIQPERNAAAALSSENMEFLLQKAEEFLQNPKKEFFVKKELTEEYLESIKGENELFILKAKPLDEKDDIAGAKLLKVFQYINKQLKNYEFTVLDTGWEWNKKEEAILYFMTPPGELEEKKLRQGPPVQAKENSDGFKQKHPGAWEENGRLYAYVKRDYTHPQQLIRDLIEDEYVKEKVNSIRIVD